MMRYAAIKDFDIANGPGIRISLFVSGCPHHCPNCFNQETWDYYYGEEFGPEQTARIIELLKGEGISGFTILGGEPMAPPNLPHVATLIEEIRHKLPDVNIWLYTGYTIEELVARWSATGNSTTAVLSSIDVLVDGRFVEEKKNLKLRFRGSSNQRIIDMKKTMIYTPDTEGEPFSIAKLVLVDEYM